MAAVLFVWELGNGLGHLARLVPVANRLAIEGHRPVFAVRHLREAGRVLGPEFGLLQAPVARGRGPAGFYAGTYADVLARHGFADVDELGPAVRAWDAVFDLARPELVVADHSPTACLAAFGRLPVVQLGDGFTLPPVDGGEFTPLGTAAPSAPESRLLETVAAVQRGRGRPRPDRLADIFATRGRFVMTFPELDPYRAVRAEPYAGPPHGWAAPTPVPGTPTAFAYVSGEYPDIGKVLTAFAAAGVRCSAHFRDGRPDDVARIRAAGVCVHDDPVSLPEVLPEVSAVVHHASLNTATAALTAGRPQLVLPRHLEQDLTANALNELGVGRTLGGSLTLGDVGRSLRELVESRTYSAQAHALAGDLHARGASGSLGPIVNRCLEIL